MTTDVDAHGRDGVSVITSGAGMTALTMHMVSGTPVKVFGVPQTDGTIKTYVLIYYTGVMPAATA